MNENGTKASEEPGSDKDKTGNTKKTILITFVVIGVFVSFLCIHENSFS